VDNLKSLSLKAYVVSFSSWDSCALRGSGEDAVAMCLCARK
jgi:hypothetical protein